MFKHLKNAATLACISFLAFFLIYKTNHLTNEKIQSNKENFKKEQIKKMLSKRAQNNSEQIEYFCLLPNNKKTSQIYTAYVEDFLDTIIIQASTKDGYSGNITLLIGINSVNEISNTLVLEHKETPGLGDKIDINKSNWSNQFIGKSLLNEAKWFLTKDYGNFDSISGATITSNAFVSLVKESLYFYQENKEKIIKQKYPECGG